MDVVQELHRCGPMIVRDNFLPDFDAVRRWALAAPFDDVKNPVDGVIYPGIRADIPDWLREQIEHGITAMLGTPPEIQTLFARLSLAGVPVPHQAHTDSTMGQWSFMLYITHQDYCRGGTALVKHITGFDRDPLGLEVHRLWERDTNKPECWIETGRCEMRANRACVFPAQLMHRAEPLGGFGTDTHNGRLVITAFFNA